MPRKSWDCSSNWRCGVLAVATAAAEAFVGTGIYRQTI